MLSASSSTGRCKGPNRYPLAVGRIVMCTSRLPEALTPSNNEANRESLKKKILAFTKFLFCAHNYILKLLEIDPQLNMAKVAK